MGTSSTFARTERRRVRAAVEAFKRIHASDPEVIALGFQGISEGMAGDAPCVVVHHTHDGDPRELERIVKAHFGSVEHVLRGAAGRAQATSVTSGDKVLHDDQGGWGTVGGWLVKRAGQDKSIYGFSNNHVIARLNKATKRSPIIVQGRTIGELAWWYDMNPFPNPNGWDFACFQLNDTETPTWVGGKKPLLPKDPANYIAPRTMAVRINTENSGSRTGRITGVNGLFDVNMHGRLLRFDGCYSIQGDNGWFSRHGDSGALLTTSNNVALGVIFARNDDTLESYALPFAYIPDLFKRYAFY